MPLVTMRQILDHAAENNYGVPAFNINDMEQIIAVLQAAKKVNAPVILQTSTGARKFAGDPMIRHMVAAGIEMFPELPICIHQDHGSSVNVCQSAIVNGYSSVMMDGSLEADGKTPSVLFCPKIMTTTRSSPYLYRILGHCCSQKALYRLRGIDLKLRRIGRKGETLIALFQLI